MAWYPKKSPSNDNQRGFSVVEVLLAATVFGLLVTGLIGAIVYGRASTASAGDTARAHFLAEEGIEAARSIGNAAYSNLVDTAATGLTQASGQWVFSGTNDATGIFTRTLAVTSAGTNRKTITSTVTWPETGGTGSVTLTAELTNWRANQKTWASAAVSGINDVTGTNDGLKTATSGNYAYTVMNVATTNNFVVTNISNPAAPTSTVFSIAGTPTNIAVYGNYAYVTNQLDTAELQVVDISNPAAPSVVASVNMIGAGNGRSVYIANSLAYVGRVGDSTASAFELTIVNISAPTLPVVLGGYNNDLTVAVNDVTVIGNNAFIANSSTSLEMLVINVAAPSAPVLLATYNAPTAVAATSIASYGNVVLLGMGTTFSAINVTAPATPALYSSFTATGSINDIAVDVTQTYAFLATANTAGEFQVINVTTPTAMTSTRILDITGTTSTFNGVAYSKVYDVVVCASAADTQEIQIVGRV